MKIKWNYNKLWKVLDKYSNMFNVENKPSALKDFYKESLEAWKVENRDVHFVDFDKDVIRNILDKTELNSLPLQIEGLTNKLFVATQKFDKEVNEILLSINHLQNKMNNDELFAILLKQEDLLLDKRLNELID